MRPSGSERLGEFVWIAYCDDGLNDTICSVYDMTCSRCTYLIALLEDVGRYCQAKARARSSDDPYTS